MPGRDKKVRGGKMIPLSIEEIAKITDGMLVFLATDEVITSVTTDSRKVEKGSLFVALVGENTDGHNYIGKAFLQGAACVICERELEEKFSKPVIEVKNSIKAMGKIACEILKRISVPTVAITGSVGKTTTRDMTHAVLSKKFNTLKNQNNFNNEIGVPLTIFNADENTQAAVIEMGMDNFGEIDRLSKIAVPDVAIITNIGMSHIERLGSQENIYKAKSEIFENLNKDGVAILNGDDDILMAHKGEILQKVITVGVKNKNADVVATNIISGEKGVSFDITGLGYNMKVELPVPGEHNVLNALLSCAAGIYYKVSEKEIEDALHSFTLTGMRMDIFEAGNITIINDCYNAAPDSVRAALSVLSKRNGRKVAILGDIAALGEYSYNAHRELGTDVVKNGIDLLVTIGENARLIAESAFENGMDSTNIISEDNIENIYSHLSQNIKENDVVLVKASRVMGLERVTEFLKNNF